MIIVCTVHVDFDKMRESLLKTYIIRKNKMARILCVTFLSIFRRRIDTIS